MNINTVKFLFEIFQKLLSHFCNVYDIYLNFFFFFFAKSNYQGHDAIFFF